MLTQYEQLLNATPEITRHERHQHRISGGGQVAQNADTPALLDDGEIDAVLPEPII
jgi:hypothetical protein